MMDKITRKEKLMDKIKVAVVEPCHFAPYDSYFALVTDGTWRDVLDLVEEELDAQYSNNKADGKDPWDGVELTIKCKYMTQAELDEAMVN
jgi:hypothetical protein